ncbi:MAG: epoxyqueuosine reductase [Proteobacteria bacterium]|nr:epoxyqueuosine reductase [Pseudomonadota bacterium]
MNDNLQHIDKGAWIRRIIEDFIQSPENTLGNSSNDRAFDKPIVGYASGDDPIFEELKADIGPFYLTPKEVFEKVYPDAGAQPEELTVISWILPHIKQTKMDNRREKTYPSERWARGKKFGVPVNMKLQNHLIKILGEVGCKAMAPCVPSHWSEQLSEKYGYASTWSERHAAYAAGLGTFGLCDGLITPVGKAMRCGSIVAQITIPPTKIPYKKHTEYCLFLTGGACGLCMTRCPVGAITEKGHDKKKCRTYCDGICTEYAKTHFDLEINVCGLCQTKVPCESGIPKRKTSRGKAT